MKQQNNISKRNRRNVMIRWKKEEEKFNEHLKMILNSKDYKILKSKLFGFLAGDGSVLIRKEKKSKVTTHHDIAFYPDHDSLIDVFIHAFTYLYMKKPTIKYRGNHYSLRVSSKQVCLDLLKNAKFGTHTWEVPLDFLDSIECKKEWLRAFFDCESYVGKRQIQLQSVNKKGIFQVKNLLEEFGIESKIYKYERKNKNWSTNYILCIGKKDSRKQFLNKVGFNHRSKLGKLEKQFASVTESG